MKQIDLNKNEKLTLTDSCGHTLEINDEIKNTYDTNTLVKNVNLDTVQGTIPTACCSHQYKLVMINGQYITYCERCGKIGDARNVFPDPSVNFITGTPNHLLTPNTVTTPGIVDIRYGYVTNPSPIKTTFENIGVRDYMTQTISQHDKGIITQGVCGEFTV